MINGGSQIIDANVYSNALGKEMNLCVYLPAEYEGAERLPVLYLLHGRSGDEKFIYDVGVKEMADRLIDCGEMMPLIIVCPNMENSRGLNSADTCTEVVSSNGMIINLGRYEDYFIDEIISFVDSRFKTFADRRYRYIGGASAGGYEALHFALRHQSLFTRVGGHMPAMELTLEEEDKPYFRSEEMWKAYDPLHIAAQNDVMTDMHFYLDAGDKDEGGFYNGCAALRMILKNREIDVQNHVFAGHHNTTYLQDNLDKYLRFYAPR